MSDNFELANLTIRNGGMGIVAKTGPVKENRATWYPNSWLYNLSIHDLIIDGTSNEGMYIGHTATYWNMTTSQPYYSVPPSSLIGVDYVQPLKWRGVKIYNNLLKNIGADGLQTAAIDQLEIYNNEITNWGLMKNPDHSGGLLVGGRTTNTNVHDNHVHHGWGDMLQFYGNSEGNARHVIHNNLFHDNYANEGVSFRGMDVNTVVQFTNNTVARPAGNCLRMNGYGGMIQLQIINANAFIQPMATSSGTIYPKNYIYVENGAQASEGTGSLANTKISTVAAAGVNVNNLFQPLAGSAIGTSGYRAK